jgi:heme A synthase
MNSRLSLLAALVLLLALTVIALGAALTSLHDRPEHQALATVHQDTSLAMIALAAIFALLILRRQPVGSAILIVFCAADSWLGFLPPSPMTATLHAWLAAMLFATLAALGWFVSPLNERGPEQVHDQGWPSLKSLTTLGVISVVVQIYLGAGYRHEVYSVLPHLLAAPVPILIVIIGAAFTLQQFPKHASLRPIAVAVLTVTSIQIGLGLVTLVMGMTQPSLTTLGLAIRVSHVVTGSITLSLCLVLAIEVRRKVLPKLEETPVQP